ncbi:MAG: hypothetical protein Q9182_003980 [Xanthomendoza sp. 2 TL-2023]
MTTRPPTSRVPTGTGGTTTANPVRRNLFHGIRRPTGAAPASATMTTADPNTTTTNIPEETRNRYDDSSDIVVRDSNGEPLFQMPQVLLPPMEEEERDGGGGNEADLGREQLLSAVQASLRRRVAALDEDNWIYEGSKPA